MTTAPVTDRERTLAVINKRVLDRLAIVVGLFGSDGWPEIQVTLDDGTTETLPVSSVVREKIKYAREVLTEFGRKPITP